MKLRLVRVAAIALTENLWHSPLALRDFIFSHRKDVTKARNAGELCAALDRGTTPAHLAGRMIGSWNFTSLYLDGYADTYGADHVTAGVKEDLDPAAADGLRTVA